MTIAVLLGAGASQDAGLPTARGMTKRLYDSLQSSDHKRLLGFVIAGLLFQQSAQGHDPFEPVDVEDLFNAVQALAKRDTSDAGPFITQWHPLVDAVQRGTADVFRDSRVAQEFDQAATLRARGIQRSDGEALVKAIRAFLEPTEVRFAGLSDTMLRQLREILAEFPEGVAHLSPLIDLFQHQGRITAATLNYDTTVETAFRDAGIEADTGIEGWVPFETLTLADGRPHVLKLHGSVNWQYLAAHQWHTDSTGHLPGPKVIIPPAGPDRPSHYTPAVVFGGDNKLTADGPYLDLLRAFQSELDEAQTLVIVGYSFRDSHVNTVVRRWFNGHDERRVVVVSPHATSRSSEFVRDLTVYPLSSRVRLIDGTAAAVFAEAMRVAHAPNWPLSMSV